MGVVGGLVKSVWRAILISSVCALVVLLIPGLPPYTSFKAIELAPTKPREGILAPNNALDNAKRLKIDELVGPEAFQVHDGALYTTLATGEVVKLSPGGHVTFVTKIGFPCEGIWQEHKCGRPLGFRIDDAGKYIYVADAYYGIWKVDLKTDKKQVLVPPNVDIEGAAPKLFNSVALAKNGDIYWTDSSHDFQLRDGSYATLVDPSGRLLHYNAARNQSRVLINGLWFANGVALSPNEEFVIVNECLASRTHRIYVNGPKKGQKDIFVDGLPGVVDNIQPLPDKSGVLIGLYKVFDEEHPMISRSLSRFPLLRKFFARILRLIEMPFEYANELFPNSFCEKVVYHIGHFDSIAPLTPKSSGVIQLDWNGNIVGAWFNEDGTAASISDAIVYQDLLYIGSPHNPFVATVPAPEQLKKAFNTKSAKAPEQPKPTEPPVVKKTVQPVKEIPKPTAKPVTEKLAPAVEKQAKPIEAKPTQEKATKPVEEKAKPQEKQARPIEIKQTTPEPAVETRTKPKGPQPAPRVPTEKPVAKPPTEKPVAKPPTEKPVAKPATEKPIAKQAAATPVTEKPAPAKPIEQPKPVQAKESAKTEPPKKETPKQTQEKRKDQKKPEQIPITEEIKVDTVRPTKESLKVIKREGPAEIPHPEL